MHARNYAGKHHARVQACTLLDVSATDYKYRENPKKMGSPQAPVPTDSLASWRAYTLQSIVPCRVTASKFQDNIDLNAAVLQGVAGRRMRGSTLRLLSFITFQGNSCLIHPQNLFRRECALEYGNFINQSGKISSGHFGVVAYADGQGIARPITGIVRALVGTFQAAVQV